MAQKRYKVFFYKRPGGGNNATYYADSEHSAIEQCKGQYGQDIEIFRVKED